MCPRQLRRCHWCSPHGITPEMLVGQVFGQPGCLPRSLLTTLVKHLTDPAAHHEATRCIRRHLDGRQLHFPGTHPPSGAKEPGPTRVSISPPVPSEDAAAPSTSTIHRRDVNDAFPVASQRLVRHPRHCGAINGNVTLFLVGAKPPHLQRRARRYAHVSISFDAAASRPRSFPPCAVQCHPH